MFVDLLQRMMRSGGVRLGLDSIHCVAGTVSAHDVARELRRRLPDAGVVKIHKLLYFVQGVHLGYSGAPLFEERIEAWLNGPVVADLWHAERRQWCPPARPLDAAQVAIVDEVVRVWGHRSGRDLIQETHADGGPWCQVTETDEMAPDRSPTITTGLMGQWFAEHGPVVAHRAAAEKAARSWRELQDADAVSSGLLGALEVAEFSRRNSGQAPR